ncbi:hypothetical protein DFR70_11750 [Nocardia tenerifensis]|uniref:Excreted virulence factor EspC (Type VII ESX diderm) n=1 Tax=Nocardia tenerifensis TaxID=228006 RepID=A0A318JVZ8_9NOCA|nr:hypothetical protein [Nocardia tenerifensis]PXX57622.1 hypothetical protein DFR70_11750 [Nocardia tenerifensis]
MTGQRRVEVDTTRLRSAAAKMEDVGKKTTEIMGTLRNNLQSHGFPWGHDDYGDKFTGGDKGYTKSSDNLLTGGDNMADSAAKFSKGMYGAANKMDDMDGRKP